MIQALTDLANWFSDVIVAIANWTLAVLLYVPQQLFSLLVDALLAVLQAIPAPAWVATTYSAAASLAAPVVWWLDLFQAQTFIAVWAGSSVLRFLIRRIPVIG